MNQFTNMSHRYFKSLSGSDIVRMMRGTRVTIHQLAEANKITMKRVRDLRITGVRGGMPAWEIFWMLRNAQLNR